MKEIMVRPQTTVRYSLASSCEFSRGASPMLLLLQTWTGRNGNSFYASLNTQRSFLSTDVMKKMSRDACLVLPESTSTIAEIDATAATVVLTIAAISTAISATASIDTTVSTADIASVSSAATADPVTAAATATAAITVNAALVVKPATPSKAASSDMSAAAATVMTATPVALAATSLLLHTSVSATFSQMRANDPTLYGYLDKGCNSLMPPASRM
eukprot:GHVT01031922.1.p1 GENE.GHVT01031922.1~~GHVT01031922.1.p1  ORF type:complete len:216 (-),score=33.99 GHVT01031922.1:55-702(-)